MSRPPRAIGIDITTCKLLPRTNGLLFVNLFGARLMYVG